MCFVFFFQSGCWCSLMLALQERWVFRNAMLCAGLSEFLPVLWHRESAVIFKAIPTMSVRLQLMMPGRGGTRKCPGEPRAGNSFALMRDATPFLNTFASAQKCLLRVLAGSSCPSLWRVATKWRDPSSAAISPLCFRRHRFRKTAASSCVRRGRRLSCGTCCLATIQRAFFLWLGECSYAYEKILCIFWGSKEYYFSSHLPKIFLRHHPPENHLPKIFLHPKIILCCFLCRRDLPFFLKSS